MCALDGLSAVALIAIIINIVVIRIIIVIIINNIGSRILAARPEGSLLAVPKSLSLCVRKLHSPAEEDDQEKTEKTETKKMKKKKGYDKAEGQHW